MTAADGVVVRRRRMVSAVPGYPGLPPRLTRSKEAGAAAPASAGRGDPADLPGRWGSVCWGSLAAATCAGRRSREQSASGTAQEVGGSNSLKSKMPRNRFFGARLKPFVVATLCRVDEASRKSV
ncbi:hypothetical protein GCM10023317_60560 [Actinopolymorpha pittospori]